MHNLAPLKSSYSKNPTLEGLMGFNIDKAKLICYLEFVSDTYKVYFDNNKFLIYYHISRDTGHQYKYANSFIEVLNIIELQLRETSVACILSSYDDDWWDEIPLWLLTKPLLIEPNYLDYFTNELKSKEDVLNVKMNPKMEENYLINVWQKFLIDNNSTFRILQ